MPRVWLGTANKLNAVNSLQGSGREMKSTESSEKREATVDCAIPDSFLEKAGFNELQRTNRV